MRFTAIKKHVIDANFFYVMVFTKQRFFGRKFHFARLGYERVFRYNTNIFYRRDAFVCGYFCNVPLCCQYMVEENSDVHWFREVTVGKCSRWSNQGPSLWWGRYWITTVVVLPHERRPRSPIMARKHSSVWRAINQLSGNGASRGPVLGILLFTNARIIFARISRVEIRLNESVDCIIYSENRLL